MFDIGFSELLVIGVVALIVIGPERLPKVARTAGAWMGRLNRYVSDVKQDINREMQLEELRKVQQEMQASAQKYEIMAEAAAEDVKEELSAVDKLAQAMSTTDGGLAAGEYEKLRAESAQGLPSGQPGQAAQQAVRSPETTVSETGKPEPAAAAEVTTEASQQLALPGLEPTDRKPG